MLYTNLQVYCLDHENFITYKQVRTEYKTGKIKQVPHFTLFIKFPLANHLFQHALFFFCMTRVCMCIGLRGL